MHQATNLNGVTRITRDTAHLLTTYLLRRWHRTVATRPPCRRSAGGRECSRLDVTLCETHGSAFLGRCTGGANVAPQDIKVAPGAFGPARGFRQSNPLRRIADRRASTLMGLQRWFTRYYNTAHFAGDISFEESPLKSSFFGRPAHWDFIAVRSNSFGSHAVILQEKRLGLQERARRSRSSAFFVASTVLPTICRLHLVR
jgi:hypothetical protein